MLSFRVLVLNLSLFHCPKCPMTSYAYLGFQKYIEGEKSLLRILTKWRCIVQPEFVETGRVARNRLLYSHKCQGQIQPRLETYNFKKSRRKRWRRRKRKGNKCVRHIFSPDRMWEKHGRTWRRAWVWRKRKHFLAGSSFQRCIFEKVIVAPVKEDLQQVFAVCRERNKWE